METHQPTPSAFPLAFHIQAPEQPVGPRGCRDISADDTSEVRLAATCLETLPAAPVKYTRDTEHDFYTLFIQLFCHFKLYTV